MTEQRVLGWLLGLTLLVAAGGCAFHPLERCTPTTRAGVHLECPVPGWTDRAFDLHLPPGWDGQSPLPLIVAFHGGGGRRAAAQRVSCPDGDPEQPACLVQVAGEAGFAVALPDGTGSRPLRNIRTWNAGGGRDGFNCASGPACRSGVDDVAYFDDLLAELGRIMPLDPRRLHATGISNGAAMSHRLACVRGDRLASIAPVGGANQHAETGGACLGQVPVLQLHGTADPCWRYEASGDSCLEGDDAGIKVGVAETMEGWRVRNGCSATPQEEALPDVDPGDATRSFLVRWPDCRAAVELIRTEGGGHTWPGGYAYLGESRIGRVARDFSASARLVEFFRAHPRP